MSTDTTRTTSVLRNDRKTVTQLLAAAEKDTDAVSVFMAGCTVADTEAAEAERVRVENERRAAELAEKERKLAEQEARLAELQRQQELAAAKAIEASKIPTRMAAAADEPANTREGAPAAACLATPNTPQQGANRDASAGQSHVAEGSASPAGRGADGPTACGAAPVSSAPTPLAERLVEVIAAEKAAAGGLPAAGTVIRAPGGPFTLIEPAAPAPADPDETPTLKLGDLNDWLKRLSVSAAQLEALGFPAHAERNAKLYKPSDKARIKAALIEWLERLA